MIVLKEKDTAQATFDFVVMKLRKQGKPSINENGTCLYGSPRGLRCAIGHLMGNKAYKGNGGTVQSLIDENEVAQPKYPWLLHLMQQAHDDAASMHMKDNNLFQATCAIKLIKAAKEEKLSPQSAQDWLDSLQ